MYAVFPRGGGDATELVLVALNVDQARVPEDSVVFTAASMVIIPVDEYEVTLLPRPAIL